MSGWLDKYEQFLLKNAHQITSIESTLRSLSFVLPGRYQNVEVVSESLYSVLQIIGMYHDRILVRASLSKDKLNAHNRYSHTMSNHHRLYKMVGVILSVTRCTELLMEMAAMAKPGDLGTQTAAMRKAANDRRAKLVVVIEVFKAILRIMLLIGYRKPVLNEPTVQRQVDLVQEPDDPLASPAKDFQPSPYKMTRTGREIPVTPVNGKMYLSEKALLAEDVKSPVFLLHQLSNKGLAAELLHILRPVVYSYLVYRGISRPNKNFLARWGPWITGFAMDYYSNQWLLAYYRESLSGGLRSLTGLEAEEIGNRRMALWWYALRGPMYQNLSRPVMNRIARLFDFPVANLFSGLLEDYIYLLDTYYFSSASQ